MKKCGKPKMLDAIKLPPPELYKHVEVWFMSSLFIEFILLLSFGSFTLHCK